MEEGCRHLVEDGLVQVGCAAGPRVLEDTEVSGRWSVGGRKTHRADVDEHGFLVRLDTPRDGVSLFHLDPANDVGLWRRIRCCARIPWET